MEDFYNKADLIFQDCECTGVNFQFEEGTQVYKTEGKYKIWPLDRKEAPEEGEDRVLESVGLLADGIQPEPWSRFKFGSGVHANYAQLAGYPSANSIKLPNSIKNKMYLSHYQDFVTEGKDMYGNKADWDGEAFRDGFRGFVKVGQTFEV